MITSNPAQCEMMSGEPDDKETLCLQYICNNLPNNARLSNPKGQSIGNDGCTITLDHEKQFDINL